MNNYNSNSPSLSLTPPPFLLSPLSLLPSLSLFTYKHMYMYTYTCQQARHVCTSTHVHTQLGHMLSRLRLQSPSKTWCFQTVAGISPLMSFTLLDQVDNIHYWGFTLHHTDQLMNSNGQKLKRKHHKERGTWLATVFSSCTSILYAIFKAERGAVILSP